jgi:hypothetical protein
MGWTELAFEEYSVKAAFGNVDLDIELVYEYKTLLFSLNLILPTRVATSSVRPRSTILASTNNLRCITLAARCRTTAISIVPKVSIISSILSSKPGHCGTIVVVRTVHGIFIIIGSVLLPYAHF